ncbi:hypothetical protein EVAR_103886_1 [Eumeta japonica]|uniref:Uncharacterized protein n=1 Tax=Eumeta variegata TaxID=151549 RepID=A0A4C1ZII5_EUMVA|nr:hypothetical protein EVAR_103886_1 [Eumeta japonica]
MGSCAGAGRYESRQHQNYCDVVRCRAYRIEDKEIRGSDTSSSQVGELSTWSSEPSTSAGPLSDRRINERRNQRLTCCLKTRHAIITIPTIPINGPTKSALGGAKALNLEWKKMGKSDPNLRTEVLALGGVVKCDYQK